MSDVTLTIDGKVFATPAGGSVMDACDRAGIYVPRLCAYPGLPALGDCGLCFVRIDGVARRACSVGAEDGMTVSTTDEEARGFRRGSMQAILGDHPHVCLTCPQRDGCSRDECVYGNPPADRCCEQFGRCEIAKVAAYAGALENASAYAHRSLPADVEKTVARRLDLCVGCGRCVAACETLEEAGDALQLVETALLVRSWNGAGQSWEPRSYLGRQVAMPKAETLRQSGCTFCGACVMVCPTGAVTTAGDRAEGWLAKRRGRTTLAPAVLPPVESMALTAEAVGAVPAAAGVFRVFDHDGNVVQISGVPDVRAGLQQVLAGGPAAGSHFVYEEDPLYTQRETELLARHVQEHGRMPRGNDMPGDLFPADDEDAV